MKKQLFIIPFLMCLITSLYAQEIKEAIQPLSAKSQKGHLFNVVNEEDGTMNVLYRMKLDKKSEVMTYENYSFDSNLKFTGTKDVQTFKEQKEDVQNVYYSAYVGGTTSFDVLSRKLKIYKELRLETWNQTRQYYQKKKTISKETVKPKNDNGKVYLGYASYDDHTNLFALVKSESKDKAQADKFIILEYYLDEKMEYKEIPVDLTGSYTLVYSAMVNGTNDTPDVVLVFAPNKGASDISKYTYFRYDLKGNLKNKVEFKSPAPALLITAVNEKDGDIYFFGNSKKSKDPYSKVFSEYCPIYNPGSIEGANIQDVYWRKSAEQSMDFFHLLKFSGDQLAFASTTAVSEIKTKFKTAPGDKGASEYRGKKFMVECFMVTPTGDYLIGGQLTGSVIMGEHLVDVYTDIVCFHFDKSGNIKAQYGIGKVNNDKKSEIFPMMQDFYPSTDGNSVYLAILEVKADVDWYTGIPTPVYFPRITKIDLGTSTVGAIKSLGESKYFLRTSFLPVLNKSENSVTYVGNDLKEKNLWLGKVVFK